jgi:hypothetical protein
MYYCAVKTKWIVGAAMGSFQITVPEFGCSDGEKPQNTFIRMG